MRIYLKEILKAKGIKQIELCKALNIPDYVMSNYVRCKSEPDFETICKIADYLKVSVDSILGRNLDYIQISNDEFKNLCEAENILKEIVEAKIDKKLIKK